MSFAMPISEIGQWDRSVLFLAGPPWVASLWSRENRNKVPKGRCDKFSFVPTPSGIVRYVKLRLGRCYLGQKKCAVVPYLRSAPLADLCLPSLLPDVSFVLRENTGMSCEPPCCNQRINWLHRHLSLSQSRSARTGQAKSQSCASQWLSQMALVASADIPPLKIKAASANLQN